MKVLYLAFAVALASTLAVCVYVPVARGLGWVDRPNSRSAHRVPVPNSGGLAILPILLVGLIVLAPVAGTPGDALPVEALALVLGAVALLAGIGAWDDRRNLGAGLRLGCFLALSLVVTLWWFPPRSPLAFFGTATLAVALTWLVNLYNFMDGLDGIAALQCVAVAGGLALHGHLAGAPLLFQGFCLVVAGAYLGFLAFNWPPARLFMGDAGSLPAGFLLGWIALWGASAGFLPVTVWLLLMSPFLVDTSWTLASRILRRERLMEAHGQHLYQRLARRWGSHRRVDTALLGLHLLWLQPLALLCVIYPGHMQTILALGLFPQLFLMVRLRGLK